MKKRSILTSPLSVRLLIPAAALVFAFAVSSGQAAEQPSKPMQGMNHEMNGMNGNHAAMKSNDAMAKKDGGMKSMAKGPKISESKAYPLDYCIVSGDKLDDPPVIKHVDGREIEFCCHDCPKKFAKNPEKYLKKLDDAIIAVQKPNYPLETGVVSGKKLGSMGKPVDLVYKNRLVRLVSNEYKTKFESDPAKYLAKVDQAVVDKQKKDYPLDTCVVSGDKLGGSMGDPIYYVYNDQLVEFCCPHCKKDFDKDPAKYMAKISAARKGVKPAGEKSMSPGSKGEMGTHKGMDSMKMHEGMDHNSMNGKKGV